jgi:hypothetical protein
MDEPESTDLLPVLEHGLPLGVPEMEAVVLQSVLADAGIEALVSGYWAEPILPFRLLVGSAEVERASQLIAVARAEALAGGAAAAEAAELAGEAAGDRPPEDIHTGGPGVF